MTTQHAMLSPSKAHRWIPCPGSIVMEAGRPDVEREEQTEGTMLHAVAAAWLRNGGHRSDEGLPMLAGNPLTDEQAEVVVAYVDKVREYAAIADALIVEQPVAVGKLTGEEGAQGTPDAVVLLPDELQVHDAKFGRVRVSAERNPQLSLYALGLLEEYGAICAFERVRLVIHQPRIGAVDEWVCTVDELRRFAETVAEAARQVKAAQQFDDGPMDEFAGFFLRPGAEQCHYCRAKAVCPALANTVEQTIGLAIEEVPDAQLVPFSDRERIAYSKKAVPLIRMWCDAVDEEVQRLLLAGEKVDGFKVVRGKRGARQWVNAEEAEKTLKSFRLSQDEMYTRKLISPTQAEDRAVQLDKKTGEPKPGHESKPIKPRQWQKLQALIVQNEGDLQVAPESDKRPAVDVKPAAADFQDETLSDLLA